MRRYVLAIAAMTVVFFTLRPTFTFAAITCSTLGLAYLFQTYKRMTFGKSLTGFFTLTVGITIRPEAKFVALALTLPMILSTLKYALAMRVTSEKVKACLFTTMLVSVVLLVQSNSFACPRSDPTKCSDWKIYTKYNQDRGQFHGSSYIDSMQQSYGDLGWSDLDMTLFNSWLYPDDEKFGPLTMHKARSLFVDEKQNTLFLLSQIELTGAARSVHDFYWLLIGLTLVIGIKHIKARRILTSSFIVPTSIITSLSITLLLLSAIRLPATVVFPSTLVSCAIAIGWLNTRVANITPKARHRSKTSKHIKLTIWLGLINAIFYVSATFFAILFARDVYLLNHSNQKLNAAGRLATDQLIGLHSTGPLLIQPGLTDSFLNRDPWNASPVLNDAKMQLMGWPVFSPHSETRLKNSGLSGIFSSFVSGSEYFVAGYRFCGPPQYALFISEYMRYEYGYQNYPLATGVVESFCEIWKFAPRPAELN